MTLLLPSPESAVLDALPHEPLGRRYRVGDVSLAEARAFFERHHYAKGCGKAPAAIYGMYEGASLIGALMFQRVGSEATNHQVYGPGLTKSVTGLHRLAILDVTPKNAESWFIARCLARLKAQRPEFLAVLTFSDPSAGHVGGIYQASNARYYGTGKREKRYQTADGGRRARRQCGVNVTDEEAAARGWTVAYDPPKHRYAFALPSGPAERRALKRAMLLPELPYPKRDVTSNGFAAPL